MRQDPYEAADALQQLIDLGYMADTGADQRSLVDLTRRESRYNLAVALMTTGRGPQAVPILEALAAEHPADRRYAATHVHALHAAGEHARCAEAAAAWAAAAPENPEPALLRAAALLALGDRAAGSAAIDAALAAHGSAPALARTFADLLARAGRWQESADHAARAIAHDPAAPEAYVSAARAALELGDFEAAAERCMDATERTMALPDAHVLLGSALAWGGELGHAATALDIALKFAPGSREALAFAAAVARAQGHEQDAGALEARLAASGNDESPFPSARRAADWVASRR